MSHFIVITTINKPTSAVLKYAEIQGHRLIVVGDLKTPEDWCCNNVEYLSIQAQKSHGKLGKILPCNHYCRKMLGYIFSINNGAEVIIDTDDDNIPKDSWWYPDFKISKRLVVSNSENSFLNIYQYFSDDPIWPRGLPLHQIQKKFDYGKNVCRDSLEVGIWQGLADDDPDVDAIYRLTNNAPCTFRNNEPIVLPKGTFCPFNSQNTVIRKELFPLLYLPATVSFRFTDILRGLVAQPIMWAAGYHLAFFEATVRQVRNEHDFMDDFISEIPVYLHAEEVSKISLRTTKSSRSIITNLRNVYRELVAHKICQKEELNILNSWLEDIS